MPDAHKNFAVSAVAVAPVPAASGTSLTVTTGHGTRFPSVPFNATVWPDGFQPDPSNAEIVRVTAIVGNVLTIARAQEGSSARAILVGDQIAATITAKTLTDAEEGVQNLAASNTTYSSGTVSITGVGGGVTVSSNTGQRIDISVAAPVAQSVQPETQTFVGGISASDALYTSGTVRVTGVGGGVTVSSNTGQRVDISVAAPVAQTVQTQNAVDVTLAGNTAGALALISSGTMTLAGGNNITVSQAGNAVTISGGAGGAVTAISGLANSQTTYTSGTVNLSVVAGNLTIRSTTGQAFQFSASQTVQAETQTFVGGVAASNTTYTSGTVSITGVGGGITVSSNTGQRIDLSVAAQTTQTQGILSAGVSTGGNTLGNTQVSTGSRLVFVGSNNITISQGTAAGATTLTISGPSVAGAQTGISGLANSQTTYTSGTVSLSELGAVTIRSTTGQQYQISVNAQSVQPETQTFLAGAAASNTTYTSGTFTVTGVGGGVTVSSNTGQRIDISVAAPVAQTVQTQGILSAGVSTGGNTAGNTQVSTGSRFVIVGSGNITASQGTAAGATTVTLSVAAGAAQTAISGLANSQTTYTSGTVSLSELGAITIRSTTGNQFQLSVNAQTVQPETQTFVGGVANSQTTYTSGTVSLSELGAITIRSTTGNQYQLSVNAQTTQTQGILSAGVSTGGNTAGNTTVNTGSRLVFVGTNMVSLSQTTGAGATTVSINATQSVQPETQTFLGAIQNSQTTYTSGTVNLSVVAGNLTIRSTTGQAFQFSMSQTVQAETQTAISGLANSQTTYTSGTVSLSELGAITIRSTTGNQFQLSVNSQTAQTQSNVQALYDGANSITTGTIRVTNANGVSFSVNAQTLSASVNESISMFAVSNTTQSSSGTAHKSALSFGGAGIASVGVTGGSVVVSVPAGGGAGDGGVFGGVSTGGNTAGSTGTVSTGNLVFVGTGPISLSQSTGAAGSAATISINAPATSSLSGTGGIQISTNGSTISIGDGGRAKADWQNFPNIAAGLMTHISGISKTPFYWNDYIDGKMTANSLLFKMSMVTASQPASFTAHFGVYTFANSTSMNLLGSFSEEFVVSSASSVSFSQIRHYVMTKIGTHTALSNLSAGEYGFGMMFSATATNAMNASLYGAGSTGGAMGIILPGTNQLSTGTTQGGMPMYGRGSTTVNALPSAVSRADLLNQGSGASLQLHPWIYIRS